MIQSLWTHPVHAYTSCRKYQAKFIYPRHTLRNSQLHHFLLFFLRLYIQLVMQLMLLFHMLLYSASCKTNLLLYMIYLQISSQQVSRDIAERTQV